MSRNRGIRDASNATKNQKRSDEVKATATAPPRAATNHRPPEGEGGDAAQVLTESKITQAVNKERLKDIGSHTTIP
tara:strand:- start:998 stop:1225 length:228 start_codon:yes stop_codon:yes gene_type:complete